MSDNYDGPAMAQQIIKLQTQMKVLISQVKTCRENEVRLRAENALLRQQIGDGMGNTTRVLNDSDAEIAMLESELKEWKSVVEPLKKEVDYLSKLWHENSRLIKENDNLKTALEKKYEKKFK